MTNDPEELITMAWGQEVWWLSTRKLNFWPLTVWQSCAQVASNEAMMKLLILQPSAIMHWLSRVFLNGLVCFPASVHVCVVPVSPLSSQTRSLMGGILNKAWLSLGCRDQWIWEEESAATKQLCESALCLFELIAGVSVLINWKWQW